MTTEQRAREMVTRVVSAVWPDDAGTLYVAPNVYADAQAFWVTFGPRELLVKVTVTSCRWTR